MTEYREVTEEVEVPRGMGVDGLLATVKKILSLPKVRDISIDTKGVVFRHFVPTDVEVLPKFDINFQTLRPSEIIRNSGVVVEVPEDPHASTAIARMLREVSTDLLVPVAFVGHPETLFWKWHQDSTGLKLSQEQDIYGLPFLTDVAIPEYALMLCAGFGRGATLQDTVKTYRLVIPQKVVDIVMDVTI